MTSPNPASPPGAARPSSRPPVALTIAGSDSGGGAGVQADLKTFSALGVYGASVLTALTAQNTRAVTAILPVPAEFVTAQLDAVLSDLDVAAIKIGMLHSAPIITAVAVALERYPQVPVVLDPVMIAKSGAALLEPAAVQALLHELLPRVAVLTPNIPEAAALLAPAAGASAAGVSAAASRAAAEAAIAADPEAACARLRALGARAVVLKGGHAGGERSDDTLCTDELTLRLLSARLPVQSTHGTGCTFSAALAAGLAHGLPLPAAALSAKRYITGAIAAAGTLCITRAEALASGRDAKKAEAPSSEEKGPVHHFYALWPAKVPTLLP